jgi:hypothetical protein
MKARSWTSKDMLYRARDELEYYGFLMCTRQGGKGTASLYALMIFAIDYCGGKLDVGPTTKPGSEWKADRDPFVRRGKNEFPAPSHGLSRSVPRAKSRAH